MSALARTHTQRHASRTFVTRAPAHVVMVEGSCIGGRPIRWNPWRLCQRSSARRRQRQVPSPFHRCSRATSRKRGQACVVHEAYRRCTKFREVPLTELSTHAAARLCAQDSAGRPPARALARADVFAGDRQQAAARGMRGRKGKGNPSTTVCGFIGARKCIGWRSPLGRGTWKAWPQRQREIQARFLVGFITGLEYGMKQGSRALGASHQAIVALQYCSSSAELILVLGVACTRVPWYLRYTYVYSSTRVQPRVPRYS